jgi:hypothetical protein
MVTHNTLQQCLLNQGNLLVRNSWQILAGMHTLFPVTSSFAGSVTAAVSCISGRMMYEGTCITRVANLLSAAMTGQVCIYTCTGRAMCLHAGTAKGSMCTSLWMSSEIYTGSHASPEALIVYLLSPLALSTADCMLQAHQHYPDLP